MEAFEAETQITETNEQRLQAIYNVQTELSEIVDGSMHTKFPLELYGNDVYAPDGRGLDETTRNGIEHAKKIAASNPNLAFMFRRARHERNEKGEVVDMAKGQGPNTLIVPSDYPEELWDAQEDIEGFNHKRKQTMLRVYMRDSETSVVTMHSRSLDGSNRKALESIYHRFNRQPESGELLGQRIHEDLTDEEQENLIGELRGIYDRSMSEQFSGEWYAGRRPADSRNTYEFVCNQHDLIERRVKLELDGVLDVNARYNIAATMQKRFSEKKQGVIRDIPYLRIVNEDFLIDEIHLTHEIQNSGNEARYRGDYFSACGVTLLSNGTMDTQGFEVTGIGDNTELTSKCQFKSEVCPDCKATDVWTTVTSSYISGSCGCFRKK